MNQDDKPGFYRELGDKLSISRDLIVFLWQRRLWWLIPLVSLMLVMGILIVVGASSGVGPFLYPLF